MNGRGRKKWLFCTSGYGTMEMCVTNFNTEVVYVFDWESN
jgi:hypothetical protein